MIDSLKLPMLIVSSPRTGSTALGNAIFKQTGVKFFPIRVMERTIESTEKECRLFLNHLEKSNQYVVKIHSHQYDLINQVTKLNPREMTLCRIRRRNIVDQVSGLYLANLRQTWSYFHKTKQYDNLISTEVEIDLDKLKYFFTLVKDANKLLDDFDTTHQVKFDYDLWYEDLVFDTTTLVTPYPTNYQNVKNEVTKIMESTI